MEKRTLTPAEALNNLRVAARAYVGNADVHDSLRDSYEILERIVREHSEKEQKAGSEG